MVQMVQFGSMVSLDVERAHYLEDTRIMIMIFNHLVSLKKLFNDVFDLLNDQLDWIVKTKHFKIFNEKIYDLTVTSDMRKPNRVKVREVNQKMYIMNVNEEIVTSAQEAIKMFTERQLEDEFSHQSACRPIYVYIMEIERFIRNGDGYDIINSQLSFVKM